MDKVKKKRFYRSVFRVLYQFCDESSEKCTYDLIMFMWISHFYGLN
jgi:hypothetical protein